MPAPAAERARDRARSPRRETAMVRFDPDQAKKDIVAAIRSPQRVDQFLSLLGGDRRLAERYITVALHAATSMNERFLKADILTIVEAVRESIALGLELNGVLGQAYLVPYWNRDKGLYDIQFQAGYRGLKDLIDRSGKVIDVNSDVVYENDEFEYEMGTKAFVRHRPAFRDRGGRLVTYTYAVLPTPTGGTWNRVVLLDEAEAEHIRKSSKAGDDSPWIHWPDEMRKKSGIRRISKLLPQDPNVERALDLEARAEQRYLPAPPADDQARGPLTGAARARAALGVAPPPAEAAKEPAAEPSRPRRRRATSEPPADEAPLPTNDVVEGQSREVDEATEAPAAATQTHCEWRLEERGGKRVLGCGQAPNHQGGHDWEPIALGQGGRVIKPGEQV